MAVVQVAGPRPARIAAAMRAGGKKIPGQLRRGFTRALEPLNLEVKRQAGAKFPSGYAPVFAASAKTTISMRGREVVRVDARIYATSGQGRRDVVALNAGVLRHPVHGRTRRLARGGVMRNPWAAQTIPAGFGDEAVEQVRPRIDASMDDVLAAVEQTITGA